MQVSFHGAAQGVTGSCHLVECAGKRILVDCGMFQGGHELEEDNAEPFGFEAGAVDFLLLTHAHLDHCGRIPLLVRRGFTGEIITTAASRELSRIVLLDSARLHEEEAKRRARKAGHRKGEREPPLYDELDALNSFERFGRTAVYGQRIELAHGIAAIFFDAGHILGSASILLELTEKERTRRILFSGDIGAGGRPLLNDPFPPSGADAVVMESTYGDRDHRPLEASVDELYAAIRDTLARGGNAIVPTFALERTQELLFYLGDGMRKGALPSSLQVFLDSPMAISATEVFRRHPECFNPAFARLSQRRRDPFGLPNLHFVREAAESAGLNRIRSGALIMAGSGMCTGGRIRHHLRHNLSHADCSIVFVGFAAKGTLARQIIDGAAEVRVLGQDVPVRARIHTINGFSAHADRSELIAWHERTGKPDVTFLVHGETGPMEALAGALDGRVEMPESHRRYPL
jgi:metallo-beta-lactamase family protein